MRKFIAAIVISLMTSLPVLSFAGPAHAAQPLAPGVQQLQDLPLDLTGPNVIGNVSNIRSATYSIVGFGEDGQRLYADVAVKVYKKTGEVVTGIIPNVPVALTSLPAPVVPGQIVIQQAGSCPILHLVLGPLNLNLLGLQVTLNQVVLDITAQPGPGNLLGNLLCAIAGLLDPGTPFPPNLGALLNALVTALNNLLAALGL